MASDGHVVAIYTNSKSYMGNPTAAATLDLTLSDLVRSKSGSLKYRGLIYIHKGAEFIYYYIY